MNYIIPINNKMNKKHKKTFNQTRGDISKYINMRKTWSGQTQVEFSTKTMDQDIADRNSR